MILVPTKLLLSIAVLATFCIQNPLSAQDIRALAVLEFDAEGISGQESRVLTNRLRTHLVQFGIFRVLERGQMETILNELDFLETGCTSDECAVQVGQLLGVELMLAGTFGKLGQTFTVDLRLIDVQSGSIIKSALFDHRGTIDDMLGVGIKRVAQDISTYAQPGTADGGGMPRGDVEYVADSVDETPVLDFQPMEERYEIPLSLEAVAFAVSADVISFMADHFPSTSAPHIETAAGNFWNKEGDFVTTVSLGSFGIILLKSQRGSKSGTFLAASQEGFPILPISALVKTIEPYRTREEDLATWYKRITLDLAATGSSKTLIILINGNGGEVEYHIDKDNPAFVEYNVRLLKQGDYNELAYDNVIRNAKHWVVTTYGDAAAKWIL